MGKLLNFIYIIFLQFSRQPIFWLLLVGFLAYEYLALSDISSPGDVLTSTSFLVQAGILAFILFGIILVQLDHRHHLEDLYSTIERGMLFNLIGKLLFGLLLSLFFTIIFYVFYLIYYLVQGFAFNHIFISAIFYMLLYFCITFFISYFIGILIAIWIKGRLAFPLALIAWGLIGPINTSFLGIHLTTLARWLNLGEPNPSGVYNGLYGLSIDWFYWLKHFVWIVTLIVFLLIALYKTYSIIKRKTFSKLIAFSFILLLVICYGLSLDRQLYITAQDEEISRELVEFLYYQKEQPEAKSLDIHALSYEINLEINRLLKTTVNMELINNQGELNELTLSLYHDFKVKELLVNGKIVQIKRDKDLVTIPLTEKWGQDESIKLTITYEGTSSSLFYANNRAIYLPYYFNWLPSVDASPSFEVDSYGTLVRNNHQLKYPTEFVLNYEGREPLYTNIPEVKPGQFKGTSSTGLSLLSGELQERSVEDVQLVYPSDIKGNHYNEMKDSTIMLLNYVSNNLGIENLTYPKQVWKAPTLSTSDNSMEEMVWYTPETLIFSYSNSSWYIDSPAYFTYWLFPAISWKYEDIEVEDRDVFRAFDLMYCYLYNQIHNIKDEGNFLDWYKNVSSQGQKKEVLYALSDWLMENDAIEEKQLFVKDWYNLMKNNNSSWENVYKLLEKYKGV
ncbi:hypothetical protein ACH0B5_14455 [Ureibacillus sp. 179-F W5.1 NHS]|uniref:Uncharacterized protein n=1 Tax=Lysinibacillus halotolerans TaxID=1368476 RepID=A0A3M8HA50_9BACI|nr:hypothetical protein [Lysinibacillus halotolerans]RNC98970.1 hypothetical protein EC501_09145 [Lysinibacillus halotolerans]